MPEEVKVVKTNPILIKVRRSDTDGKLMVHIKCPSLEDFFASISEGRTIVSNAGQEGNWLGREFYTLPDSHVNAFRSVGHGTIHNVGEGVWVGGEPNLSMLRAKGLREGVDFVFPGVFTEGQVARMAKGLRVAVDDIFREFMGDVTYIWKGSFCRLERD